MPQGAKRRSAREIDARRKARELSASVRAREQKLEDLATRYLVAGQEIADIDERTTTKIKEYTDRVQAEAEETKGPLRVEMAGAVREMLTLDRIGSVSDRLGEPREVVSQLKADLASEETASAAAGPGAPAQERAPDFGGMPSAATDPTPDVPAGEAAGS
jgi:hypothetical protein